tara:strand:+ start:1364 stop:3715 length:2352 start_codon:yes stop_codon:yes gene_type:complete
MIFLGKFIKSVTIILTLIFLIIFSIYSFFIYKPESIIFAANKILDNNYTIQFQNAKSYSKFLSPKISYTKIKIIEKDQGEIFKADEFKIGINLFRSIINNYIHLDIFYLDKIEILNNANSENISNGFKYKIKDVYIGSEEFIFSSKNTEMININGNLSIYNKDGTLNNLPFSELGIYKDASSSKYLFNAKFNLDENIIEKEELLNLDQFIKNAINLNVETKGFFDSETGNILSLNKYIFNESSLVTNTEYKIDEINSVLFTNLDKKIVGIFSAKIPDQNIEGSIMSLDEKIIMQSNILINMNETINYGQYFNFKGNENFYVKLIIKDKTSLELISDLGKTEIHSDLKDLYKKKNEILETKIYISDISLPTYYIENNKFKAFIDNKNNGYFSLGSSFDNEIKQFNFNEGFYIYLELDNFKIDNLKINYDFENDSNLKLIKLKINKFNFFKNIYKNQNFEINFDQNETHASFNGDNLNGNLRIDSSGFTRINIFDTKFEFNEVNIFESNDSLKLDNVNLRFVGKNIQVFNDTFEDVDFYLLRNNVITTVDDINILSRSLNIGPSRDNEKAYIAYNNQSDLYKLKGSYEINNKNDLFRDLINYDFEYLFSDLNIQWKSINQLKELEGKITFKIKDLKSKANLPDSSLFKALKILNLNALIENLSNDSGFNASNLIISRAEGDLYIGKNRALLNAPVKFETAEAKMTWTGEILKNENGLLDELDLNLKMRLKISENIPWYAAIFGGIPALAGGLVFENIIDERLDDVSTFNFDVSGSINDPLINRLD